MGRFLRVEAALAAAVTGRDRRRLTMSLLIFALPFAPCRTCPSKGRSIGMRWRRKGALGGFPELPQAQSTGPTPTARVEAARLCRGPAPLLAGTGESASALRQRAVGLLLPDPGDRTPACSLHPGVRMLVLPRGVNSDPEKVFGPSEMEAGPQRVTGARSNTR